MVYADYPFYTETYGGTAVDAARWPALALRASAFVDRLTFGRLAAGADVTDDVRMAVCAVAEVEAALAEAEAGGRGVAAENNDGYSIRYESGAARAAQAQSDRLAAAELFLRRDGPLRYAGAALC